MGSAAGRLGQAPMWQTGSQPLMPRVMGWQSDGGGGHARAPQVYHPSRRGRRRGSEEEGTLHLQVALVMAEHDGRGPGLRQLRGIEPEPDVPRHALVHLAPAGCSRRQCSAAIFTEGDTSSLCWNFIKTTSGLHWQGMFSGGALRGSVMSRKALS